MTFIKHVILEYLHEKELLSADEESDDGQEACSTPLSDEESDNGQQASSATLELKRLDFQENERARENALCMKELEIKKEELPMQLKLKELEAKTMSPHESHSKSMGFDSSKHIQFAPLFQQREIDKCFLHFEKVATGLEWLSDI